MLIGLMFCAFNQLICWMSYATTAMDGGSACFVGTINRSEWIARLRRRMAVSPRAPTVGATPWNKTLFYVVAPRLKRLLLVPYTPANAHSTPSNYGF